MALPPGVTTARLLLDAYGEGSVILSPTVPLFRLPEDGGAALYPTKAIGALVGPGRYVDIVSTDANVTPKPFQWRIQYALEGLPEQPDSILFNAPAGSVQSLADLTPVDLAPSIVKVVSDEDRRAAEAAAAAAQDSALAAAESAAEAASGPGGSAGGEFPRSGTSWSVTHNLGRRPVVELYVNDERVFSKVTSTTTVAVAEFPTPQTGLMVVK